MQTHRLLSTMRRVAPWFCGPCLLPGLVGCSPSATSTQAAAPPSAAVALVQRGTIANLLSVAGQFQPYQVVQVHAKVSGYLRHIYVDIGDRVHAGETLGVLEVPELNAQYRRTEAEALRASDAIHTAQEEVARAQATHGTLQAAFSRLERASEAQPGLIAAQELDNARAQADASGAQVDAAKSSLAGAREGAASAAADQAQVGALQAYSVVTAPLTGVVTARFADTGALIQAGTTSDTTTLPLVTLAQSDVLRLRVPVPEDAVRYVHVGAPMHIYVAALNRSFTGKVVRFSRDLSMSTRTMQTEVDLPNPELTITPGMYANAYLQLDQAQNVLTIPAAAVQGTGSTGTVLVVDPGGHVQLREVRLGLRGSVLVQVVDGLRQGEEVVLGDRSQFRAGQRVIVRVQPEPASDRMREEGGEIDPFASDDAAQSTGAEGSR